MSGMSAIDRRKLLVGMGAALTAPSMTAAAAPSELRKIAPVDAGFAADLDGRLDKLITAGRAWKLHGVVIIRNGALVLERDDAGEDEIWGRPIGRVAFGPDTLHDLRSVTKSILGLLYGLALAQGKVPAPDRPLLDAFPEYAEIATDPRHKRLTIAHALTMSLGLEWNEDIPYQDPANSEIQMERAADRYRYILSRPFVADPGARWIYGAAATALIGKLIQNGTGQSLPEFARGQLVRPDRRRRDRMEPRLQRRTLRVIRASHDAARSRAHRATDPQPRTVGGTSGRAGAMARQVVSALRGM
jgi:CubicO group peptidase (beta-lactamase class C family)